VSDWKITKGPIDIDELQAYIQDLGDIRNKEDFPKLRFREETLIITDIRCKFEGKHRMVTVDSKGRKKLFDISDPFYSDGEVLYFDTELVELGWKEYYSYWKKLGTRPDVIEWRGDPYIVYSFTKVTGEDGIYVVIGSKPTERITIKFDQNTIINRDNTQIGVRPRWIVKYAKMIMDAQKWD
jgi:hypothetical protein